MSSSNSPAATNSIRIASIVGFVFGAIQLSLGAAADSILKSDNIVGVWWVGLTAIIAVLVVGLSVTNRCVGCCLAFLFSVITIIICGVGAIIDLVAWAYFVEYDVCVNQKGTCYGQDDYDKCSNARSCISPNRDCSCVMGLFAVILSVVMFGYCVVVCGATCCSSKKKTETTLPRDIVHRHDSPFQQEATIAVQYYNQHLGTVASNSNSSYKNVGSMDIEKSV